eukprot:PhM_4_TR6638/c0_g1_i1/m.91859
MGNRRCRHHPPHGGVAVLLPRRLRAACERHTNVVEYRNVGPQGVSRAAACGRHDGRARRAVDALHRATSVSVVLGAIGWVRVRADDVDVPQPGGVRVLLRDQLRGVPHRVLGRRRLPCLRVLGEHVGLSRVRLHGVRSLRQPPRQRALPGDLARLRHPRRDGADLGLRRGQVRSQANQGSQRRHVPAGRVAALTLGGAAAAVRPPRQAAPRGGPPLAASTNERGAAASLDVAVAKQGGSEDVRRHAGDRDRSPRVHPSPNTAAREPASLLRGGGSGRAGSVRQGLRRPLEAIGGPRPGPRRPHRKARPRNVSRENQWHRECGPRAACSQGER